MSPDCSDAFPEIRCRKDYATKARRQKIASGFPITSRKSLMTTQTKQQKQDRAETLNRNAGTSGNNPKNAKANGNRGKQLNPNKR